MILLLKKGAEDAEIRAVVERASRVTGHPARVTISGDRNIVRLSSGAHLPSDHGLRDLPGVERIVTQDLPYVLASREVHPEATVIRVGKAVIGGDRVVVSAGPCAVESRDQLRRSAEAACAGGATLLRGGAFKPRTSPYSFQGLGEEALKLLREIGTEFGLAIVTEVMAPEQVPLVASYADILQIGSRSIQNFPLLEAVGKVRRPVLLKRGMMSEIDEFLASAEYILTRGNPEVILCERGIRTFERRTRNTFDVVAIPLLKELTHLPVFADPSHATGKASLVGPAAKAAVAAGADGLLIEIHPDPAAALSDGPQALRPDEFQRLCRELAPIALAVGRRI